MSILLVFGLILVGSLLLSVFLRRRPRVQDRSHSSSAPKSATRIRSSRKRFNLGSPIPSSKLGFTENDDTPDLLAQDVIDFVDAAPAEVDALEIEAPCEPKVVQNYPPLMLIHLEAAPGTVFSGYSLLQALLASNLRYGDRKIFHCHMSSASDSDVFFSVATLNKPGTFDLPNIAGFECKGLIFFSELEHQEDPAKAMQLLHAAGQKTQSILGGQLTDENRVPIGEPLVEMAEV